MGFKIIKKNHADNIFLAEIAERDKDIFGNRLSQQQIGQKIHRRLFGVSALYCNKNAGYDDLDDVMMVSDPEVYLPVNSGDRLLFSTELPDFVVTALLTLRGQENGEDVDMMHSLRFIPRIEFISLEQLPDVYNAIVERCANLPVDGISYPQLQDDLDKIKKLVDNAK